MTEFDDAAARKWLDRVGWLSHNECAATRQVTAIRALVWKHVQAERTAVVAFGRNKPAPGNRAVWAFVAEVERGEHLEASDEQP